ncbi:MAG TPA: DUF805 domain-containing protein [Ruania sp.]|nr:DUF805 domain-containing protein [Ruania sp.]
MPVPGYARGTAQIPTPSGLGFGQAIREVFSKYGVFRGRATRSEYWWWQLFSFLVFWLPVVGAVVISIVAGTMESASGADVEGWYALSGLLLVLGAITGLALLVPNLAVAVRRLHDMDFSGWVYLIVLIPSVGGVILFVMFLMPSKPHPNQYGLPPALRA